MPVLGVFTVKYCVSKLTAFLECILFINWLFYEYSFHRKEGGNEYKSKIPEGKVVWNTILFIVSLYKFP